MQHRHRILYVSPFAFKASGADESLIEILRNLPKDRFQTFVVIPRGSPYTERLKEVCHKVVSIPMMRLKRSMNPLYWILYLIWLPIEVLIFFYLLLWHHIDLVHINMESTLAAAFSANIVAIPVIIHYRGNTTSRPKWFFDRFLRLVTRISHLVICISHTNSLGFIDRNLHHKLKVLYNPVDLVRFSTPKSRSYFLSKGISKTTAVVTYVGRLHPRKRVLDLIEAFQIIYENSHHNLCLAIVGGDPNIDLEQKYLQILKERVSLVGNDFPVYFIGHEADIPSVLHSSHCLVLPSIDEGFGRILVEAMAANVPVVGTRSGAIPELLQNGKYGWLCNTKSPKDLATVIIEVFNDQTKAMEKASKAQKYAETVFSPRHYITELTSYYSQFLDSKDA
ncbi:MAG: glycosyltransferase family 4 protein [Bdellovibrionales bacterium]|nr:glycosyltransferase family 4 protein [Bdellovibrionales bacterium]